MLNQYQILNQFPDAVCTILQQYTDTKKSNRLLDQAEQDQLQKMDRDEKERLLNQVESEHKQIESRYEQGKKENNSNKAAKMDEASKRYEAWRQAADTYQARIESAYQLVERQLALCAYDTETHGPNEVFNRATVREVLKQESSKLSSRMIDYNAPLLELERKSKQLSEEAGRQLADLRAQVQENYNEEIKEIETQYNSQAAELEEEHSRSLEQWRHKREQQNGEQQAAAQKRMQVQQEQAQQKAMELDRQFQEHFAEKLQVEQVHQAYQNVYGEIPSYKGYRAVQTSMGGLVMGESVCDITPYMSDPIVSDCVKKHLSFALCRENHQDQIVLPYGVAFQDEGLSAVIGYESSCRSMVISNLNAIAMQLFMSNPAGKIRFTFISPSDAGDAFATFMRFTDVDERLVDTHVWVEAPRIEERLDILLNRAQTINQDYLRGQYANILEYNQAAGKNAEPLQFLIVADFPRGFTQSALEKLESVMSNGPKNGIYTLLSGDMNELMGADESNDQRYQNVLRRICGKLSFFRYDEDGLHAPVVLSETVAKEEHAAPDVLYRPIVLPEDHNLVDSTIDTMIRAIRMAERVTITYDDVMDNLTSKPERWFGYTDRAGISAPFALSGPNKVVSLEMAADVMSPKYHTLITGMIGSGKSTLLHTIIMGILLKYSPEDVQIYLMDFKDGVEFKVYTEYNLQNFRAISIDTEPEFGLTVLKQIEREMEERNRLFKSGGFRGLESYRSAMEESGEGHPHMPRIVLIVDEFQEAFGKSDDPIMSQAAEIVKRLTLVGRAPAIYLIMATQDIKNAAALPETVYNQFETRIALKSSPDSARIVLPDNPIADQLINLDKGVAIFNASAGNKDHNVQCRIAYCSEKEQRALLQRIADNQETMHYDLKNHRTRLLLSSIQDDRSNPLNLFVHEGYRPERVHAATLGYRLFIGEGLTMENRFHPELTSRAGQNVLLTGRDQNRARTTTAFIVMSLLYEALRLGENLSHPLIKLFDFGLDLPGDDTLNALQQALPAGWIRIYRTPEVLEGLSVLSQELGQEYRQFVILFGLSRARRLLVQQDMYSVPPKNTLLELLRKGPAEGMNFVVWANSAESFLENYGEALPAFDHRLVGDIQEEQYSAFTFNPAPGNMKLKNAVYANMDQEDVKVRLYERPTEQWIEGYIAQMSQALQSRLESAQQPAGKNEWW